MSRSARPIAAILVLAALGGAAIAWRLAWGRYLRAIDRSLVAVDSVADAGQRRDAGDTPDAGTAGGPRILLFGDSRIAAWDPLPDVPGATVLVRGVPGETTVRARARLVRTVETDRPDLVVLQTGVNDLKAIGVFPDRAAPITRDVEANLRAMIEALDDGSRQVVLLTIVPLGRRDLARRLAWSQGIEPALAGVNERLRGWSRPGLTLVDCDPLLAAGGVVETRYAADTLHLNREGYRVLNAAIEPILARLVTAAPARPASAAPIR